MTDTTSINHIAKGLNIVKKNMQEKWRTDD